jgi:hypothetical protein
MATFIPGGLYGVARQLGRQARTAMERRRERQPPAAPPATVEQGA